MVDELFDDPAFRAALQRGLGWRAVQLESQPGWAFERTRAGLRRWELGPMGLYASASAPQDLGLLLAEARRRASSVRSQARPGVHPEQTTSQAVAARLGYALSTRETHLLRVQPTVAAQRAGYHATKRSQIARTAPDDTLIAPGAAADLDDYWALYLESLRRWGRSDVPYPRALFEALLDSPAVRLWTLRVAGQLLGAVMIFETRTQALYWQGVSRAADAVAPAAGTSAGAGATLTTAYPLLRLMDAVLADLAVRGIPELNLGASQGLPQVARFKAELGAQPVSYPALAWDSAAWRAAQALQAGALRIIRR